MNTNFFIQAGCPHAMMARDEDDADLNDAIQTIFSSNTEDALLVWNFIYLRLSYKYDISVMIDDIMKIVETLLDDPHGYMEIHWASNTFPSIWNMKWSDKILSIYSKWHSGIGGLESFLIERPQVTLPIDDFIAEWKRPLAIVRQALNNAGYSTTQIPQLIRLNLILSRIPRHGLLYQNDPPPVNTSPDKPIIFP